MICTRSMRVISGVECQSLTQKLRVVAVDDEGRAVHHHGDGLGLDAVAQLFQQLGHVLPELLELEDDRRLVNLGGRQLHRLVGFEQQTRLGLLVSFFDYSHS